MNKVKLKLLRDTCLGVDCNGIVGEVIEADPQLTNDLMLAGAAVKAPANAKVGKPKTPAKKKGKAEPEGNSESAAENLQSEPEAE